MNIKEYLIELKDIINIMEEVGLDIVPFRFLKGFLPIIARNVSPEIILVYFALRQSYYLYNKYLDNLLSSCLEFDNDERKYNLCILAMKYEALMERIKKLQEVYDKKSSNLLKKKIDILTNKAEKYKLEYNELLLS